MSAQRNTAAIHAIRTDSNATTLDRYIQSGNQSIRRDILTIEKKEAKRVVPIELMSIRKLIYTFERDIDENLQNLFKKHSYVGMIDPN